jgi:DNA polymerase-3 subunit delta
MTDSPPPVVYLLHGEDEMAIAQHVAGILARLGETLIADMNTTRLDGRVVSLEEVETAAGTLPFMAKRRVVILTHPLARLTTPASRQKFLAFLERVPPSAALVLVEAQSLTEEKDRKKGRLHWLEKWAVGAGDRVFVKACPLPQGQAMTRRIQDLAKNAGGQISPPAAELLASLVGENLLGIDQEVQKLVAYTNYSRPVEPDDVEHLTADQGHGDIFMLVDAIGSRDSRLALNMLHRLLEEQEALSIFSMVVRQFRLLLLAREIMDHGGQAGDVARLVKLHPFVADKVTAQARRFTLAGLADIYHRLLDLDEGMKSGEIEGPLALDTFIAGMAQ